MKTPQEILTNHLENDLTEGLLSPRNRIINAMEEYAAQERNKLTPYCCPVCNGSKIVPAGFYLSRSGHCNVNSASPEPCQSCNQTGIVWG